MSNQRMVGNCLSSPRGSTLILVRHPSKRVCCQAKSLYVLSDSKSVVCYKHGSCRIGVRNFEVRLDRVRCATRSFFGAPYDITTIPLLYSKVYGRLRLTIRAARYARDTLVRCLGRGLPGCVLPGRVRYVSRFPIAGDGGASHGGVTRLVGRGGLWGRWWV